MYDGFIVLQQRLSCHPLSSHIVLDGGPMGIEKLPVHMGAEGVDEQGRHGGRFHERHIGR